MDITEDNYFGAWQSIVRCSRYGETRQRGRSVMTNANLPVAEFNCVYLSGPDADATDLLSEAAACFAARALPFDVVVPDGPHIAELSERLGRTPSRRERVPGLVCDRVPTLAEPQELSIEPLRGASDLAAFREVVAEAFTMAPALAGAMLTETLFEAPHVVGLVGRVEGVAVATALLVQSHGVAGIYWVGTRPQMRGRGYGAALTRRATLAGFSRGARLASLQSSESGMAMYQRLGFVPHRSYHRFRFAA